MKTLSDAYFKCLVSGLSKSKCLFMHNNFFIMVLLCCISQSSFSQINKNKFEIKGTAGYLSDAYFAVAIDNSILVFKGDESKTISYGIYSSDALIRIGQSNFMAVISYGYEKMYVKYKNYPASKEYYYNNNFLAGIQYNYLVHGKTNAYSGLQLGMRNKKETDYSDYEPPSATNDNRFAYDITFIGVRYGKKLGGFFECGFGAKGFVRTGVSYQF